MLDWIPIAKLPKANHIYGNGKDSPFITGAAGEDSFWPWYDPNKALFVPGQWPEGVDKKSNSYTLSMLDSPTFAFPRYYKGNTQMPLLAGIGIYAFNVYVGAQTSDSEPQFLPMSISGVLPSGIAGRLFFSEASTSWQLIFSALGGMGTKIVGHVNTSATVWRQQQTPFMPDVNAVPAIVGANSPYRSWD
jgi:hypothetical protein